MTEAREPDGVDAPEPATPPGSLTPSFWAGRGPRSLGFATLTLIGGSVAVLALHSGDASGPHYRAVDMASSVPQTPDDPLMGELVRCRALPPQASDPACERAWDENRRRFFGETRATRVPGDPQPHYGPIPAPASTAVAGPSPSPMPKDH
ncbi:putative entry exclusion protein TrbK-alt [Sphingomonas echinoides]|uniref:putative entry exclusion protein TrbK-alt n=1 Tax=Sphingomonas echinoides TaxID=59803 RepID=UPI003EED5113